MTATPVTIVSALGRPVTNVANVNGAVPMTVVDALGEPVTLVDAGGEPVTLLNADGTLYSGSGPAPVTFDFYVDSVGGLDSNAGTLAAPFQTIAAASTALASAGTSLGLFRGSTWSEQFTIPRTGFRIGVVGTGAPPVFEGSDIIAGTWVKHANTTDFPDVWQVAVTRPIGGPTEFMSYWENDVRPTYRTSLTLLQANGGWNASSLTGVNPTVFIRLAVGDPNTDGIVRRYTRRNHAIVAHPQVIAANRTLETTGPIEARRFHAHYNAFAPSFGPDKQLFLRDGNIHHMVSAADLTEDIIATELTAHWTPEAVPLTWYVADGSAWDPVVKRCMVDLEQNPGAALNINGLYSHDSGSGVRSIEFEQIYTRLNQTGIAAATLDLKVRGHYSHNDRRSVVISALASSVTNSIFRDNITGSGANLNDGGPVDPQVKARVIENCVFYVSPGTAANAPAIQLSTRNGSIIIRNCIFIVSGVTTPSPVIALFAATSLDVTLEYNIFVRTADFGGARRNMQLTAAASTLTSNYNIFLGDCSADGGAQIDMDIRGTLNRTLAAQQAAGYDSQSVHLASGSNLATILSTYFEGAPSAGDFRLKAGIGTFPDGTSLNLAGPQSHWNWNTRAVASGAPSRWPVPPATDAERRTYINDPAAWNFYP